MNRILNIGVDACPLAFRPNGIGRYTSNLLREFALQQSPHRIFLYSDRPFQLGFPMPEHWQMRTGGLRIRALSTAFEQVYFPIWALKDRIDVFWSTLSHLPVLMPPHIRQILTVHDVVWKRFPQTMTRRGRLGESLLMPLSLRIANHIITDSRFTRSEVLTLFPRTRCEIDVIYLASTLRTDGESDPCPLSAPYFLFVGSMEPRKNLKRLLLAYIQYRKLCHCPIDLVLVGTYQWGDFNVIDFIQINDLQLCVHLFQNVDDNKLASLYAHAHALIMVSLYEGFGLPLVEAMQWNKPLIASNCSSVAEVAGDAALLVDPCDTDAIANAFKLMTEDEAMRLELASKSEVHGQQFSWTKAAAETMAIIIGD